MHVFFLLFNLTADDKSVNVCLRRQGHALPCYPHRRDCPINKEPINSGQYPLQITVKKQTNKTVSYNRQTIESSLQS